MADTKISALNAISGTASGDKLAIADISDLSETFSITIDTLLAKLFSTMDVNSQTFDNVGQINVNALGKIYLDGGTDTSISESADGTIKLDKTSNLEMRAKEGANARMNLYTFNSSAKPVQFRGFVAKGTEASPLKVGDGSVLMNNQAAGWRDDGAGATGYQTGATFKAVAKGDFLTSTDHPCEWQFTTSATGDSSAVISLLVTQGHGVVLGSSVALGTTATDGFAWLPTVAGTPTGVPITYTGKAASVYDTTNNILYIYNGAWKGVALS